MMSEDTDDDDIDYDDDDEDEDDDEEEQESSPGMGGKKKLLFIAVGVVVLLLGGGGAAYFLGALDSLFGSDDEAATELLIAPQGPPIYMELPELLASLKSGKCKNPYIKVRLMAVLWKEEDKSALEKLNPKNINGFQVHLRSLEPMDIEGTAGTESLRLRFRSIVNRLAAPVKIHDILFQEIMIR